MAKILSLSDQERIELERDLLQFAFVKQIHNHMHDKKKKDLATEIGVSNSFISQIFSGDKKINIDLLTKFQRVLDFKFVIDSVPNKVQIDDDVRPLLNYNIETNLSATTNSPFCVNER